MSERGDNPNINDPAASLPVKRKRGRPRKYDVPANEPRARRRQPPGSSQGPLVIDHRPGSNLSVVLSRRSQAVGSSGSKASLGSTPLIRPQHNAASQTVPPQIRDGRQEVHTAVSTDQAIPMQSRMVSDSGIQSPANLPHVPHTLVGQTVYGYLEATFSYGYVISVKIEETGEILKGVLYDPLLSNPIHVQDDIAAAAPEVDSNPVADDVPNAIEAEVQTKPLQPVLMTKDTDDQNENSSQDELQQHDLCKSESESSSGLAAKQTCQLQSDTEKLYKALGLDGVHEIFEESDIVEEPANDQVMHEVVETSATVIELAIDSNLVADDVPNAIEAEVQTKPLQPVLMTEDTDDQNENLSQDEPQQHDLWKSESESSSGLVAKQTRQLQSDTEKLYKALGLDGVHEIFEESDIAEELANDQVMHEVVETSATVIELAVDSNLVADDVPNAIEAEVQTKPLQPVLVTMDTDYQNENSSQDASQRHDLRKSESECSSGLAAKQTSQLEKLYKSLGLDGVHESSEESYDEPEVVESSAAVIELAVGNEHQNSLQSSPQQPVD